MFILNLICLSEVERKISSDFRLSLGALSKWNGEQGAVDAGTAVLGGYQATRQRYVTGAREMGKMNKSVDKGFEKMKGGITIACPLPYLLS